MHKKDIRLEILGQLIEMPIATRKQYNRELLDKLVASDSWLDAKHIGVTLSRGAEVDTQAIIEQAWNDGKTVSIPFSGKERKLSFYRYTPETELELSPFGLLEPKDRTNEESKDNIDLMIVPGLAYNQDGYRVGFGGGYYDRYLTDFKGKKIALLYPFQLDERVDDLVESFDVPVEKLFVASK